MVKSILFTLLVVFACLGISDCVHALISVIIAPDVRCKKHLVVLLRSEFAAQQLRHSISDLRWYGTEFCDDIIGVVDRLDDTQISDCESFCYGNKVYLCRFDNIKNQLDFLETGEVDGEEYGTEE